MLPADGAASPLVVIYLCMVASAALSFDRHMVWFVTAACVVSYALVVVMSPWLHPTVASRADSPHHSRSHQHRGDRAHAVLRAPLLPRADDTAP